MVSPTAEMQDLSTHKQTRSKPPFAYHHSLTKTNKIKTTICLPSLSYINKMGGTGTHNFLGKQNIIAISSIFCKTVYYLQVSKHEKVLPFSEN